MESVVIIAAKRTAVGRLNGVLSSVRASDLSAALIAHLLKFKNIAADEIDQVILGQTLTAGAGQNPARQAAIKAGIDVKTPAMIVNQLCGSGLRSVILAAQQIMLGEAKIVVCGGQESMSQSPHVMPLRVGKKFGDVEIKDTILVDALWDHFNDYHMGVTAENLAEKYGILREKQDHFALFSQEKAQKAIEKGIFKDEILPFEVKIRKEIKMIDQDEHPTFGTSLETLSKLRPAFKANGTVTAGNASGINDGAAILILMSESEAKRRNLNPLAKIEAWGSAGVDPSLMGIAPVGAIKNALSSASWSLKELDILELNEAFAAQALSVLKELEYDEQKVNPCGGAIALGHPIGASGARILTTLIYALHREDQQKGMASACIGGGMGIALAISR